jgi:hypothetical protein
MKDIECYISYNNTPGASDASVPAGGLTRCLMAAIGLLVPWASFNHGAF